MELWKQSIGDDKIGMLRGDLFYRGCAVFNEDNFMTGILENNFEEPSGNRIVFSDKDPCGCVHLVSLALLIEPLRGNSYAAGGRLLIEATHRGVARFSVMRERASV